MEPFGDSPLKLPVKGSCEGLLFRAPLRAPLRVPLRVPLKGALKASVKGSFFGFEGLGCTFRV